MAPRSGVGHRRGERALQPETSLSLWWAQIKTETSFLNGLVELITSGIYSPQTVTVRCNANVPPPPATVPAPVAPAEPAPQANR